MIFWSFKPRKQFIPSKKFKEDQYLEQPIENVKEAIKLVLPTSSLVNVFPIIAQDIIEGLQQHVKKIAKFQWLDT